MKSFNEWLSQRDENGFNELFEPENSRKLYQAKGVGTGEFIEKRMAEDNFMDVYLSRKGFEFLSQFQSSVDDFGKKMSLMEKISLLGNNIASDILTPLNMFYPDKIFRLKPLEDGIRKAISGDPSASSRGIDLFKRAVIRLANQYGAVPQDSPSGMQIMSRKLAEKLDKSGKLGNLDIAADPRDQAEKQARLQNVRNPPQSRIPTKFGLRRS